MVDNAFDIIISGPQAKNQLCLRRKYQFTGLILLVIAALFILRVNCYVCSCFILMDPYPRQSCEYLIYFFNAPSIRLSGSG